jgi:hypothetical protein
MIHCSGPERVSVASTLLNEGDMDICYSKSYAIFELSFRIIPEKRENNFTMTYDTTI